jgi:ABC-type bacteriocin/lantibiotic exporter with double-glycine peptidase domain
MMDRLVFLTALREHVNQSKSRRTLELWGMMDARIDDSASAFETSLLDTLLLQETNKENSSLMGEVKQTVIIGLGAALVVTETITLGTLLAFYIATYAIDDYALALLKAYTQFLGSKEMVRPLASRLSPLACTLHP